MGSLFRGRKEIKGPYVGVEFSTEECDPVVG
jgi:hypothetical protein